MTFGELSNEYQTYLPQLNGDKVCKRWAIRWFDGPLSGTAVYQEQFCLFEDRGNDTIRQRMDDEGQTWNDWYKPFVLLELTAEQQDALKKQNELFREAVGNYWDYDEDGKPLPAHLRFFTLKKCTRNTTTKNSLTCPSATTLS